MAERRSVISTAYVALALIALVTCWRQNLLFMQQEQIDLATGFVAFWPALLENHATTSITVDIFLFGTAATLFMVLEARRLAIRHVWLYVIFGFVIAISVTFPLFMAARERAQRARGEATGALGAADVAGLLVLGVPIVGFALWTLGR